MHISARQLMALALPLLVAASGCGPGMVSDDGSETEDALSASCSTRLSVASVTATSAQTGNPVSHVLDGDLTTRWSASGKGQYLVAKLASAQSLCAVQVAWYQGTARKNHFVIAVSNDGHTFTNVVAKDSSGTSTGLETYPLTSTVAGALYVRLTVNGNTLNDWASVTELRAIGATATAPSGGKPGPSNTGVPAGTTLTRLNGDQTINAAWMSAHPTGVPAGAGAGVMQDQDIYGTVRVDVPGFTLRRCRVRGKQSQPALAEFEALVFVTVGSAAKDVRSTVLIEDNEIAPTYPSQGVDGIFGYNFTAKRNDIHHTIDGFGLEFFTDVEANWVHDLTYFDHDAGHTNGTHNDCAQLHNITTGPVSGKGGENKIVGNFFSAFIAQDAGTPSTQAKVQQGVPGFGWNHQAMSDIMINSNFENTITDNWFEGGYAPVNGLDTGNPAHDLGVIQRNVFDGMRWDNPGKAFGISSLGSFDVTPRLTLAFSKGSSVNTGAGTANANKFEAQPTTPGVVGGAEVLVRFE